MKPWKRAFLLIIVALTILSLLLSACGPVENSHGNPDRGKDKAKNGDQEKDKDKGKEGKESNVNKILICHKTGSAKKPYVQISVASDAIQDGHGAHKGDLIPAPKDGCPAKGIAADPPTK